MIIGGKAAVNHPTADMCYTRLDPEYMLNNNGTYVWWAEEIN